MEIITAILALIIVAIIFLPYIRDGINFVVKMSQIPDPPKSPLVPILGFFPRMKAIQKEIGCDPPTAVYTVGKEIVMNNEKIQREGVWRFWAGPIPLVIVTRAEAAEVLLKKKNLS